MRPDQLSGQSVSDPESARFTPANGLLIARLQGVRAAAVDDEGTALEVATASYGFGAVTWLGMACLASCMATVPPLFRIMIRFKLRARLRLFRVSCSNSWAAL